MDSRVSLPSTSPSLKERLARRRERLSRRRAVVRAQLERQGIRPETPVETGEYSVDGVEDEFREIRELRRSVQRLEIILAETRPG